MRSDVMMRYSLATSYMHRPLWLSSHCLFLRGQGMGILSAPQATLLLDSEKDIHADPWRLMWRCMLAIKKVEENS